VPCENADVVGSGADTFADADGDGTADGLGSSDTGAAAIVRVNGTATEGGTGVVRGVGPDGDGDLDLVLRADAADCAVLVVWEDADDDGAFDVPGDGRPAEPYGVGQASWT
jgi:hypothetical protein